MTQQEQKKDIGALWTKQSKNGNEFMSGQITTPGGELIKIICFQNNYKKEDKHPDWRIFIKEDTPRTQTEQNIKAEQANQDAINNVQVNEVPF